jgi:hypothetical protein
VLTLTATPAMGSTFAGWMGGGCSGTGTCVVTVTAATSVTATFNISQYTLTVTKSGTGFGTVTSGGNPPIINCGSDCTEVVNHGTVVTLTATAASSPVAQDSTFTGWSGGGCTGTGTCVVTVTAATTVTATFTLDPNFVFVTNATTPSAMGGLAGADAFCQNAANTAGLAGTYRAFLSSTTVNFASSARIGNASGWIRRDGKPFALTQADLFNGVHRYPARFDENGNDMGNVNFWTGSSLNGTVNGGTCGDWTVNGSGSVGIGNSSGLNQVWVGISGGGCTGSRNLTCFGVDRNAPIPTPAPATGRRAFVTNNTFNPSMGLAAADAVCAMEASQAGYSGTFRALTASTTGSAASRFGTSGQFVRPDGVVLGTASQVLTGALWDTANNVTPSLTHLGNYGSFSGAATPTTIGTAATTCTNWTTQATGTFTGGRVGDSLVSQSFGAFAGVGCASSYQIYCLEL